MKITDVQTFIVGNPWKNWVFIELHTAEGIYEIGEATSHRKAKTAETAVIEMRRYYLGRNPFAERIVDYPIEIKDGYVIIPDRPGLGLDLNETEMAKYPYDESHFLDLYGEGGWEKRNLGEA